MAGMNIGEVARKMGLRSSAIRYYERLGLIPKAPRVSGRRRYDERVLERLAMVRFAKHVGFSVAEIKVLLGGVEGRPPTERWRKLACRESRSSRSIRRPGAIDPKTVVGDAGFPMSKIG
jgi:MerR family transcriptional regulator, redox-sensitive transcriptional activator SoxR